MLMQRKELSFEGQNIFIGIDVHLKSWTVSIFTEKLFHKTFTQPPKVESLKKYLDFNFPNANYYSVYEAGFSGNCSLKIPSSAIFLPWVISRYDWLVLMVSKFIPSIALKHQPMVLSV